MLCIAAQKEMSMTLVSWTLLRLPTYEPGPNRFHQEKVLFLCNLDQFIQFCKVKSERLGGENVNLNLRLGGMAPPCSTYLFAQNMLSSQQRRLGVFIVHRMGSANIHNIYILVRENVVVAAMRSSRFGVCCRGKDVVDEFLGGRDGTRSNGGDDVTDVRGVSSGVR
jgi:hypothetical protein